MELQTSFGMLSEILERHESRGGSVRDVETRTVDGDALAVSIDVPVSLCTAAGGLDSGIAPETATLTDEGTLRIEFSTPPLVSLPPSTGATVSTERQGVRVVDDEVLATVELTIEPVDAGRDTARNAPRADPAADSISEETDPFAAVRDDAVPPYEDTEYLQALYDSCETFDEMRETIEMDVSAETVRRYMIEADVHDPTTYETRTDGESKDTPASATPEDESTRTPTTGESARTLPEEQLVTDGIGLPEDLEIADVANAVVDSVTVYEVHRRLGIDRDRTRDLLEQLNLLDLVLCRLSDGPKRDVTYEQVAARIRQCGPERA